MYLLLWGYCTLRIVTKCYLCQCVWYVHKLSVTSLGKWQHLRKSVNHKILLCNCLPWKEMNWDVMHVAHHLLLFYCIHCMHLLLFCYREALNHHLHIEMLRRINFVYVKAFGNVHLTHGGTNTQTKSLYSR